MWLAKTVTNVPSRDPGNWNTLLEASDESLGFLGSKHVMMDQQTLCIFESLAYLVSSRPTRDLVLNKTKQNKVDGMYTQPMLIKFRHRIVTAQIT